MKGRKLVDGSAVTSRTDTRPEPVVTFRPDPERMIRGILYLYALATSPEGKRLIAQRQGSVEGAPSAGAIQTGEEGGARC